MNDTQEQKELTGKNPCARLIIKREDNNKILLDHYVLFNSWSTGYVQCSWNDAGEKALEKVQELSNCNYHFKDEEGNQINEVILIAEYVNQRSFPKIKCKIKKETIYRFHKYQVTNPNEESK